MTRTLIATARRRTIRNELVIVSAFRETGYAHAVFSVTRTVNGASSFESTCYSADAAIKQAKELFHLQTIGEWHEEQDRIDLQRATEGASIDHEIDDLQFTIQRLTMGASAQVNLAHLIKPFQDDLAALKARRAALEA